MPVEIEAFLSAYAPKFICINCLAAVTSRDEADVRATVQMLLAERRAETRVARAICRSEVVEYHWRVYAEGRP